MEAVFNIKKNIILKGFEYKKKREPYNEDESERHTLPASCGHTENDSHFFNANSPEKGITLSARVGKRTGGNTEVFVLYKRENHFYVQEQDVYADSEAPLSAELVKVGQEWLYKFDGVVIDLLDGSRHRLSFNARFEAVRPIYDYFHHCKRFDGMASAIANQKWSKRYFDQLKTLSQRHYEQTGRMRAEIVLDGTSGEINMASTRDHSFGVRDWDFMDDHIWFACQNSNGNAFCFSVVNYPLMKRIYCGYTDLGHDGANHSLISYKINGYSHCGGLGPDDLEISFIMDDGVRYGVSMHREDNVKISFDNGDYIFQEGLATFIINGEKFRGTIEYGFNKNRDRWEDFE